MEKIISDLFDELHSNPEESEKEIKTKEIIKNFIKNNTDFEIFDLDGGFYCTYINKNNKKNILVRTDYDAVSNGETPRHLCGHDGHTAALCALLYKVYKNGCDNNVYFLFQGAEENGCGAKKCMDVFKNNIDEAYGVHNLPGFEFGKIYTSLDTFALASCGLGLVFEGKPSHAAYPENGISPCNALFKIVEYLNCHNVDGNMSTICGGNFGPRNFGTSAHNGEIYMTLRSTSFEKLKKFKNDIISLATKLAQNDGLELRCESDDVFPDVTNNSDCAKKILDLMDGVLLESPMRWSEDFGWYLKENKGAFMGVGAGNIPALHTKDYCYPKELIEITANKLFCLVSNKIE